MVHSCVVLQALVAQPLGAHAVHAELARLLDEDNGATLDLPDDVIEDIKGELLTLTATRRFYSLLKCLKNLSNAYILSFGNF